MSEDSDRALRAWANRATDWPGTAVRQLIAENDKLKHGLTKLELAELHRLLTANPRTMSFAQYGERLSTFMLPLVRSVCDARENGAPVEQARVGLLAAINLLHFIDTPANVANVNAALNTLIAAVRLER